MDKKQPMAVVKPHFEYPGHERQSYPVERITAKWIVIRFNERVIAKHDRVHGWPAGAFRDRFSGTPDTILNLKELNDLAEASGGTWPPKKAKQGK